MKLTYPLQIYPCRMWISWEADSAALLNLAYTPPPPPPPPTIGNIIISNLTFCDVFHSIANLTPLWDPNCDSADKQLLPLNTIVCSYSPTPFLQQQYLNSGTWSQRQTIWWLLVYALTKFASKSGSWCEYAFQQSSFTRHGLMREIWN